MQKETVGRVTAISKWEEIPSQIHTGSVRCGHMPVKELGQSSSAEGQHLSCPLARGH